MNPRTHKSLEALAIAEMTILSSGSHQDRVCFPEPPRSPLTLQGMSTDILRIELMRKLQEANEQVNKPWKRRVEISRAKQLEAEDAFRKWNIESWKDQKAIRAKRSMKGDNFPRFSFLSHVNEHEPLSNFPKPVLKRNVSVNSLLNWKQVEKQLVTPRIKSWFIHSTVPEQSYYMVFAVNQGVPSIARWIRIVS
ncbi:unnamed protein product [Microthlaspi erraticum]|uniref:Uncharacterized protein n=1 Tax=Microthlaspi erraticum TaxID=1685480 RepID=A0A6D2JQH7_9BRAS|nr:unnamed protein product [Microthlaspi erraticum]